MGQPCSAKATQVPARFNRAADGMEKCQKAPCEGVNAVALGGSAKPAGTVDSLPLQYSTYVGALDMKETPLHTCMRG